MEISDTKVQNVSIGKKNNYITRKNGNKRSVNERSDDCRSEILQFESIMRVDTSHTLSPPPLATIFGDDAA